MTGNEKLKQPTISQLVSAVKEHNGLDIAKKDITDEIYANATKGFERGVSLKSMANRVRFYLAGSGKDDEVKETVSSRGVFMGSRDIATEKRPLGKNKAQSLSFLEEGDDGMFRVMYDPNPPSHFRGFKKDRFGALVDVDFSFSKKGDVTYVSPENVTPVGKSFEIDTSKIKVYPIGALADLEDYTACAGVGTVASFKPARIPPWEQDKYPDDEDYPLVINKNPVFTLYLESDEEKGEPIIKAVVNPTHISKPFIKLDDFDMMMPEVSDDDMDDEDFLHDEITPMYNGVDVILIGQKKRSSDYDDKVFVDFDVTAIIPVDGAPSLIETKSGVKKAKDAKSKAKKGKVVGKKDSKKDAAENEAKKDAIRQGEVAKVVASNINTTVEDVKDTVDKKYLTGVSDDTIEEYIDAAIDDLTKTLVPEVAKVVTAMMDATTVDVVRDMVEKKYLSGVSDDVVQGYIDAEFEAQGIPTEEAEDESESEETPEESEAEAPVDDEPENAEEEDDVWNE